MIEQISQLLNDPKQMQEISKIAATLSASQNEEIPDLKNTLPPGITGFLHSAQEREEKQQALVRALLPYLRPNHQKKLEQAIKIAQITHWAGVTMRAQEQKSAEEDHLDL